MPDRPLAVILATADLRRLYTGLSLLVSAAADGRPATGLVTFASLAALADPAALATRALRPEELPELTEAGRRTFARSLQELHSTAGELDGCALYACAASVETTGLQVSAPLRGVLPMPRFLRETAGAELVVV
jgi:peroxiredoxin family protein